MQESTQGNMEGYDEYLKILNTLGDDKKVNNILRRANKVLVKPALSKYRSSNFPASLLKNISVGVAKVEGKSHPNAVVVGPTTKASAMRFLNTGTKDRYTKKGAYRGKIVGKNIIASMLDEEAKTIQQDAIEEYGKALVDITAKDVKKINKNK